MAKKEEQIEGQMSLAMCLNSEHYVVQSNNFVNTKQHLNKNEGKLIRTAIMQIKREDKELKPYVITVSEFADLIGTSKNDVYRDIRKICMGITKKPVEIKQKREVTGKIVEQWAAIPWTKRCEYDTGTGMIYITLNDELKPFLLDLQEQYTQYTLDNILGMKSQYGFRLFELIQSRIMARVIPKSGISVEVMLDDLRDSLGLEGKYKTFGSLRQKVIDAGVQDINTYTLYRVTYDYIKERSKIIGLRFHVNMSYH